MQKPLCNLSLVQIHQYYCFYFYLLQTCERERRQRELEARLERQRQIEADRNKKALDRALAPPYVRVRFIVIIKFMFAHFICK